MSDDLFRAWGEPAQSQLSSDGLLGELRIGLRDFDRDTSHEQAGSFGDEPDPVDAQSAPSRPRRELSAAALAAMSRLLMVSGHGDLVRPHESHPVEETIEIVLPSGFVIELPLGGVIVAGRDAKVCDLVVSHERASRRHLQIDRTTGGLSATDLGSSNGTIVRRSESVIRLIQDEPITLVDGDAVEVAGGPEIFVVRHRTLSA